MVHFGADVRRLLRDRAHGRQRRGISCFFMPRFLPDGSRNDIRIQRLKDKLGNKSNASSELEFDGTVAWLVGEEGRGIPTILQMGVFTRLDCSLGSTGIMHQCVAQAVHHARHRRAFGRRLHRTAADAQRAGRHGAGGRGGSRAVDAARARLRPHRRRLRGRVPARDDGSLQVLDLPHAARRLRSRRWKCWAATATSKRHRWRASTASCRSTRSGRAPATSCASTSCAHSAVRRRRPRPIAQVLQPARGSHPVYDRFCDRLTARFGAGTRRSNWSRRRGNWWAIWRWRSRRRSCCSIPARSAISSAAPGSTVRAGSGMTFGNLPAHPAMASLIERALPDVG